MSRSIHIIGGGIVGASTLYYLAQRLPRNASVTLLEAAHGLAPGASGKSGGFLARDWHGAATSDLAELSYRLHAELAKSEGGVEKWGYREVETLQVNFDDSTKRPKCPASIPWVDTGKISSTSSLGGSGSTAQVTPAPLVEHLVAAARQKSDNVHVRTGTRVVGLEMLDGKVTGVKVKTEEGEEEVLESTDVVVAAGPWTGTLLESILPASASLPSFIKTARSIGGSRAHSVVIQAAAPGTTSHCLFTDMHWDGGRSAAAPEVYARADGTVYVCGGSDDVVLPDLAADVGYDAKATKKLIEQAAVLAPKVLAKEAGATVQKEQACYLPISEKSGNPVVAGDTKSGLYVAAGHSCWGITLGLGTGLVVSELVLDGKASSANIRSLH